MCSSDLIVNFIVITKGAGRIAEVAARFTLDAMPGKQMAIDAELNAGLIDETTARRRRAELGRETDFYAAMDGASKFIKGDAIAAIVIMLINLVAGIVIGVAVILTAIFNVVGWIVVTVGGEVILHDVQEFQDWKAKGGRPYLDHLGWPINPTPPDHEDDE